MKKIQGEEDNPLTATITEVRRPSRPPPPPPWPPLAAPPGARGRGWPRPGRGSSRAWPRALAARGRGPPCLGHPREREREGGLGNPA